MRGVGTAESLGLLVVSPCRDEVDFVQRTFHSVVGQTVLPDLWVIVDDGSTDGTSEALNGLARGIPWVRVVSAPSRNQRDVGPAVVNAVYVGLAGVDLSEYGYICKLDMDLILPPSYLEECLTAFDEQPRLGSFSGKVFYRDQHGTVVSEGIGDDVSVGALKMYRVDAFRQMGGLVRAVMWDGIDCQRLRMMGWQARSSSGDSLDVEHLRPMGSSDSGVIRGRSRWGRGQYFMGTGPLWIVISACYRMFRRPYLVGGVAILYGYLVALITKSPRLDDREFRRFLQHYHALCVLTGKAEAVRRIEREMEPVWSPGTPGPWGDQAGESEATARA